MRLLVVAAALSLGTTPVAAGPEPVEIVRDLTKLPQGPYRVTQTVERTSEVTVEPKGAAPTRTTLRMSVTIDASVVVTPDEVVVLVLRVRVARNDLKYDSDGAPEAQAPTLRARFHHLRLRKARCKLDALGTKGGFVGLDAAWHALASSEAPAKKKLAATLRDQYGDANLDRMFAAGAGAFGARKHRALKTGQTYQADLIAAGLQGTRKRMPHTIRVGLVDDDHVRLHVHWTHEALEPVPDRTTPGIASTRTEGTSKLTVRRDCGMAVGVETTEKRLDRLHHGEVPTMRTDESTTRSTLRFTAGRASNMRLEGALLRDMVKVFGAYYRTAIEASDRAKALTTRGTGEHVVHARAEALQLLAKQYGITWIVRGATIYIDLKDPPAKPK